MRSQIISNLEELKTLAQNLAQDIQDKTLILLEGPLGVGKTQLVRFMAEELKVPSDEICSPSFSLLNIYKSDKAVLAHADFFRLKNADDLESIAFWDAFHQAQIVFVEWPNKKDEKDKLLIGAWPQHWKVIHISMDFDKDSQKRVIEIKS